MINLFATLPFGTVANRLTWEVKVAGLACVFTYAFFKFAWAYRLFNYSAILLGAVPPKGADVPEPEMLRTVSRIASMNVSAGSHFARGQRAFFFALAYLGWFVSPVILFGSTTFVVCVMWHRQFLSRIRASCSPWANASMRVLWREQAMSADAETIATTMLRLVEERGAGKTICPSEVARELGGPHPDGWGPLMQPVAAGGGAPRP